MMTLDDNVKTRRIKIPKTLGVMQSLDNYIFVYYTTNDKALKLKMCYDGIRLIYRNIKDKELRQQFKTYYVGMLTDEWDY